MILSILIPTLPERWNMLVLLLPKLKAPGVEVLTDNGPEPTGVKRNNLLKRAQGEYIVFVDDDDDVLNDYVNEILKALQSKPDAVGFRGLITTNGRKRKFFIISRECGYKETILGYERYNNHLSPVKREIALKVMFKPVSYGEDYDYAFRMRRHIKTEVFIDKFLYYYRYVSKK